jgi:hypothetical protein
VAAQESSRSFDCGALRAPSLRVTLSLLAALVYGREFNLIAAVSGRGASNLQGKTLFHWCSLLFA